MRFLYFIFLFYSFHGFSQSGVGELLEELPKEYVSSSSTNYHSSVRPLIRQSNRVNLVLTSTGVREKKNRFSLIPVADLNGSYLNGAAYRLGAGMRFEFANDKWYARVSGVSGIGSNDAVFNTMAFYREPKSFGYTYADMRGRVSYTPNSIFNFQAGLDNQFIGEGNRSLFLSDYGTPSPFAQIRTRFWRVEYTVMYQFFREKFNAKYRSKFGATHHLSLNATKWLNIGVFETVIFRPKDSLLNRGYDAEYLNPVIFYRPQEYSLGSSDNVLLGFSMNMHWKKNMFYTQLIFDEFSLNELRARTGWWANKFGAQLGYKSSFKRRKNHFFYRLEYNFVRPYTYAHVDNMHNYGNQSSPLAHPLGSNFHEILGELKWQKEKLLVKLFASYRLQGLDKDSLNFGSDIYQSYNNRPSDYGNFIGQGLGINSIQTILTFDYEFYSPVNLHCFIENHFRYSTQTSNINYFPVIGIRSQLWNDYRNY